MSTLGQGKNQHRHRISVFFEGIGIGIAIDFTSLESVPCPERNPVFVHATPASQASSPRIVFGLPIAPDFAKVKIPHPFDGGGGIFP